jgi:hypothetical protein
MIQHPAVSLAQVLPPIDFEEPGSCGAGVWVVHITHHHGHDFHLAWTERGARRALHQYLAESCLSLRDGCDDAPILRQALVEGDDYGDDDAAIYGELYWDIWFEEIIGREADEPLID